MIYLIAGVFLAGVGSVFVVAFLVEATRDWRYKRKKAKIERSRPTVGWQVRTIVVTQNIEEGIFSSYRWEASCKDRDAKELMVGYAKHPVDAVIAALRGEA